CSAPVSLFTFSTFFHVAPPSVVFQMPRSPPGPKSGPVAATSTVLLSSGSMMMRPMCLEVVRPIDLYVLPPSVDLSTPSPQHVPWRLVGPPGARQHTYA